MRGRVTQLPAIRSPSPSDGLGPLPAMLTELGPAAAFAWDEFFAGIIRNKHTRTAYRRAVHRFLNWLTTQNAVLPQVSPGMVGTYLDSLPLAAPTKKLELAALRAFFDLMTQRHVTVLNPAASVRGERVQVLEGVTPEITPAQARTLLDSILPVTVAGLRDRAIIATLVFTAARAGAVAALTRGSFEHDGTQYVLRFLEKGGKRRLIPVRHDLEQMLLAYLAATDLIAAPATSPLFRSIAGRSGRITDRGLTGADICRLVKRRLRAAGLPPRLSPHSFRVCTVTDLLSQGVPLSDVQYLAGHADPRTTRLYDRRQRSVSRNIVERISV